MTLEKVYDELYGMIDDLKKQIAAGGGSDVSITPALESGTKIADFTIGEDEGVLYAPAQTPYSHDYSDTEQQIGTWLDGETPVYEKTVSVGALPSTSGAKTAAHGITDLNRVVEISILAVNETTKLALVNPYGYPTIDGKLLTSVTVDTTNVSVSVGSDLSAYTAYAILRYTKTPAETKKTKKK